VTERAQDVLSSEELDAILASVAGAARHEEGAAPRRRSGPDLRTGALARPLRRLTDEQSRLLSTLHQRSIRFEPLGSESLTCGDFAGSLTPLDRVALIEFLPEGELGALLIGRSLLYGWLTMALGGPRDTPLAIPDRAYSAIEERFLRGVAVDLTQRLEAALRMVRPVELCLRDVVEPHRIQSLAAPRLSVVSYDAVGFGDVARLRIALPGAWVDGIERRPLGDASKTGAPIGSRLMEMTVSLHAEIGGARLPVRRVAGLQVGDTIPLEPVEGGAILVRLENRPKFRALQGAVGSRLALQLTDEVQ